MATTSRTDRTRGPERIEPRTRLGKVVVEKDAAPDDPQDFSFAAAGGLTPASFSLDDDADATLSNTRTFSGVTPGSGYSVAEAVPPSGWEQAGASCDDGSPVSNIDVSQGEIVTCTFVNHQLGYARPKSATPLTFKLVPAFAQCVEPANATHGAPLGAPSCNPPSQSSIHLTLNAPDRPAPFDTKANGSATITLKVTCLTPGTTTETGESSPCPATGDQADVKITSTLTDVRCVAVSGGCAATGGQYGGEVLGLITLWITDRLNGPAETKAGTVTDYPLTWGLQCSGGGCSSTTSANALVPSLVKEQKRTVWELGQVYDGGADGDADTADNTLFAVQGLFAP